MPKQLTLEPAVFDALAAGGGGAAAISSLRSIALNRHLVLIGHLIREWPGPATDRDRVVELMEHCRHVNPMSFSSVFGAPLVGAWAAIASRAVLRAGAQPVDFEHLGAVVATACAAAGVDGRVRVPVRDGVVAIPGHGAAHVGGTGADVSISDGQMVVHGQGVAVPVRTSDGPRWEAVRHLARDAGGHRISLALDDVDPYRHGHHAPPTGRQSAGEVNRWQTLFDEAWGLLVEHAPERAEELAAGLTALVPLVSDGKAALSATIRQVFGVFGLSRPPSADEFAVTLVHEFQHSKLSAALEVSPFSDPGDRRLYFAPWRTDPRPLAGLLQGVYAFLGVADTWRRLRAVERLRRSAEVKFAEARLQVDRALESVEQSKALTPIGIRLVERLRLTTDNLLAESVSSEAAATARLALHRTRESWTARNGLPA